MAESVHQEVKALPLAAEHARQGAAFTTLDGWQVVAHYGDAAGEHRTVCRAAGWTDRSYRGKLRVTGPDRGGLLQSMSTNDVLKMPVGSLIDDAICTAHGKPTSLFTLIRLEDAYLLDLDPMLTASTAAFLDRYTIIRDAKTENVSAQFGHIGLYGPHASAVLAQAFEMEEGGAPGPGVVRHLAGGVLAAGSFELAVPGFEILVPVAALAEVWARIDGAGRRAGGGPFGFAAQESLRIESGRPRFGVEIDAQHILLEGGMASYMSFEKGCYIGQETLSRVVFRGQLNRRLCGLVVEGPVPAPGAKVMDGEKEVGEVKSALLSPVLGKVIALAYLRSAYWPVGSRVTVDGHPAGVAEVPFAAMAGKTQ